MGADPAVGEYLPVAPVSDEARKHNERLPGMGGVFNYANLVVYHYGGNNPLKYVDPDGRDILSVNSVPYKDDARPNTLLGFGQVSVQGYGCVLATYVRMANRLSSSPVSLEQANEVAKSMNLYEGSTRNLLTQDSGARLISELSGRRVEFAFSVSGSLTDMQLGLHIADASGIDYLVAARIGRTDDPKFGHSLNIVDVLSLPAILSGQDQSVLDTTGTVRRSFLQEDNNEYFKRFDFFRVYEPYPESASTLERN